jgi:hypothetical protein
LSTGSADPAFPEESRLSALAACPLFSAMPERVLRELAHVAHRRSYEAEQVLFRRGDPSGSAFVLCSGHVQARIRSDDGRDLVLHASAPPEAPGYLDLIDEAPRSVDAVAQDDVEVLVLPAQAVRQALIDHPRALMEMSIELAGIIRLLDELVRDLVFLDLPARLASCCWRGRPPTAASSSAPPRVRWRRSSGWPASRSTARSANLQRQGLIRMQDSGRSVELLDRMALRRLAVAARRSLSQM